MSEGLEVILVEDHLAVRKGLELLLRGEGMRVAGVAAGVAEARHLLERRRHDVVLLDVRLEDGDGIDLVREAAQRGIASNFVIHTGDTGRERLEAAARSGARGFVLKSAAPSTLINALRQVAAGGAYVDPALAALLAPRGCSTEFERLSRREREILDLLATGLNGEEIAHRLVISPETVRTHVRNAMTKLGAHTRVHAVAMAVTHRVG